MGSGFWLFSAWPSSPWASLRRKLRQLPIPRLIPICCMGDTMATVLDIMATMATPMEVTTMERDLLRLSQLLPPLLMPRLRLTRGTDTTDTDMVLDTMDMVLGTMVASMVTTATTARDLLRLSLLLPLLPKLRLIPICCTEDTTATVLDIMAMAMATPMDMSTESKSNARTEENEVPTFLTTTCQMFSTSEKNQKTKHSSN